ncbi:hypothetical protein E3T43_02700 [Cryobacterium sp. Hh7]|nr:hypothetical protein E3T43_02700 [Cryobacterium sp. Hh7]
MGAEARVLGHGGVAVVARAAGVSRVTVTGGVRELDAGDEPLGRTRRVGGRRKSVTKTDPGRAALLALVEPESRGDPESPLRGTTKSLRHLADEFTQAGCPVSAPTVAGLLREENFSLQGDARRSRAATIRTGMPSSLTSTPRP